MIFYFYCIYVYAFHVVSGCMLDAYPYTINSFTLIYPPALSPLASFFWCVACCRTDMQFCVFPGRIFLLACMCVSSGALPHSAFVIHILNI